MKIEIGGIYRHRSNPHVGYARVLEIIPPRTGINTSNSQVVKVQWSTDDKFEFGLIKYFRKSLLMKGVEWDGQTC